MYIKQFLHNSNSFISKAVVGTVSAIDSVNPTSAIILYQLVMTGNFYGIVVRTYINIVLLHGSHENIFKACSHCTNYALEGSSVRDNPQNVEKIVKCTCMILERLCNYLTIAT